MVTKKKLEETVELLRDKIKVTDGVVIVPDNLVEKLLPETLTMKDIKETQEFKRQLISPLTRVIGEKSLEIMKEEDSTTELTTTVKYGHEELAFNIRRETKALDEKGKEETRYGVVTVSDKVTLGRYQEEYDDVLQALNETFTSAFKTKK
jgi:hypothetical protein